MDDIMNLAVILPAAGASSRYQAAGGVRSKLDEDMGGKPVLQRVVEAFAKFDDDEVRLGPIIVAGPGDPQEFQEFAERHQDRLALLGAQLVMGGVQHRWQTVIAALAKVPATCSHVAIHDAARPCVSPALLSRVCRAARQCPAVVPALACADTVKRTVATKRRVSSANATAAAILGESQGEGTPLRAVSETLDRRGLVLVQTPQVFEVALLRAGYDKFLALPESNRPAITDDASVVELAGHEVVVVEGEARNIKLTLPEDLPVARALMGFKEPEAKSAHKRF